MQFARAVRAGPHIFVAGTAAVDASGTVAPNDAAAQTRYVLNKIERAVVALGGRRDHIVRTRLFLTRRSDAEVVGAEHAKFFAGIYPAATMVFIDGLVADDMVVEVEAEAYVTEREG